MKTGLVLEGGALRTIYSSGVTDGFLEMGIDFPYVIGVSAGIAYGVSYVSKQFGRNRDILLNYANDSRYMGVSNMLRPGNGHCYFGLDFTYNTIPNQLIPYDYDTYDAFLANGGECEAVITDMTSGEAMYRPVDVHEEKMLLLQATCALPLLFPQYSYEGVPCMDGGIADAIPWKHALDKGCDKIVVVLTRERSYRRQHEKVEKLIDRMYKKYPKFIEAMQTRADRYTADREALFEAERAGKAFIFCPENTEGFSRMEKDVDKIKHLWEEGRRHAHEREDELRAFLKQ